MAQDEMIQRRARTVPETACRAGISPSMMWKEIADGECESITIGDRRLITEEQETRWLERKAERAKQRRAARAARRLQPAE